MGKKIDKLLDHIEKENKLEGNSKWIKIRKELLEIVDLITQVVPQTMYTILFWEIFKFLFSLI